MTTIIKREPVLIRNLIVAILAIAGAALPDLDIGTVEGIIMGVVALLLGVDARSKVTPVADPRL